MIVLRTPKGWTGPKEVDGLPVEGTFRAHQVPLAELAENPEHLAQLEAWMRSYRPEELFDEHGRPRPERAAPAPAGERRMGANPHANGGLLLRDLRLPDFRDYAVDVAAPGATLERGDARARRLAARRRARRTPRRSASSARTRPPPTGSAPSFEATDRAWMAEIAADRRPPLARRPRDGGPLASTSARAGSRATC